jgi:hypothetical protein
MDDLKDQIIALLKEQVADLKMQLEHYRKEKEEFYKLYEANSGETLENQKVGLSHDQAILRHMELLRSFVQKKPELQVVADTHKFLTEGITRLLEVDKMKPVGKSRKTVL